jgi:hypothetical protein
MRAATRSARAGPSRAPVGSRGKPVPDLQQLDDNSKPARRSVHSDGAAESGPRAGHARQTRSGPRRVSRSLGDPPRRADSRDGRTRIEPHLVYRSSRWAGTMVGMWPPPAQPVNLTIAHTRCPTCHGEGAVAHLRAMVLVSRGEVWGYEAKPCQDCDGQGWLPGVVPPL